MFVVKSLGSTQELLRILADLRPVGVTGTDGGAVKCVDIVRNANGEDRYWAGSDTEARKRGERTGLDTPVVHALNDVDWIAEALTPSWSKQKC